MLNPQTLENGKEQYETYSHGRDGKLTQYDYRTHGGDLFSTVRKTLDDCRDARDKWIMSK